MAAVCESARDFILFPRDHIHAGDVVYNSGELLDGYDRSSLNMDPYSQYGLPDRSTQEGYPATSAYSAAPIYYNGSQPQYASSMKPTEHMTRPTPSASPSSLSHTVDNAPSIMSSASGASAQSTSSSSVEGSPYIHAHQQPLQEKWTDSPYGLGINPQGATSDFFAHDPTTGALHDHSGVHLDPSRYPDYVGEYRENISSFFPTSASSTSSTLSASTSQDFSVLSSSPVAMPQEFEDRHPSLDAVPELVGGHTHTSIPRSVQSRSTSLTSGSSGNSPQPTLSSSFDPTAPFRSPSAPVHRLSPVARRDSQSKHYEPYPVLRQPSVPSLLSRQRQNLFFNQSSGRFVPPLSSCRFPFSPLWLLFASIGGSK